MKKFLTIALCATVALASCSKSDDNAQEPEVALLPAISETFDNGTDNSPINLKDWTVTNTKGELSWNVKNVKNNKYVEITTFRGKTETPLAVGQYESWLVSPALDLTKSKIKSFSFESAYNFWKEGNTFEVYMLTDPNPTKCTPEKLTAKIPANINEAYEIWYNSGNIDLSKYKTKIYIAFKYTGTIDADATKSATTTFRLDNFRVNVEPKIAETPETALTVDKAILATAQDSTVKWVKGIVIGYAVGVKPSGFTIKLKDFAGSDNTNIVLSTSATEGDPAKCIAVQLPNKTLVRAKLNLVENPSLIGKEVLVKGILSSYFKKPGVNFVSDFTIK